MSTTLTSKAKPNVVWRPAPVGNILAVRKVIKNNVLQYEIVIHLSEALQIVLYYTEKDYQIWLDELEAAKSLTPEKL
jgi:hypothetical protein